MKRVSLVLHGLVLAALLLAFSPSAHAAAKQTAAPPAKTEPAKTTPAETPARSPGVTLSPFAQQIGQTLQTLVRSAPAPAAAVPPAQTPAPAPGQTPADTAAPTPPAESDDLAVQITDTFSTGLINAFSKASETLKANSAALKSHASFLPELKEWLSVQAKDTRRAALWSSIGDDLVIIVLPPVLIGLAFLLFLIPLRQKVKNHKPKSLLGRLGLVAGLLFLRLVPVLAFMGTALMLLEQNETHRFQRYVVVNLIYAIGLGYTIPQLFRSIFSPTAEHLRSLPLTTAQALTGYRWLSALSVAIVFSYFLTDVASAVRVPASVIAVYEYLVAIILTGFAVVGISRSRQVVATILRGDVANQEPLDFLRALRLWLAKHWHKLAITYLFVSLTITLVGVDNGFALMLQGTVLTLLVLGAVRLAFVGIEKWSTPKAGSPVLVHRQFLSFLLRLATWAAAALGILASWGLNVRGLFATPYGQRLTSSVISVTITLAILTVIYEMIHNSIERHLNLRDKESKALLASARARTLLPMVRASLFIVFTATALLMSLSAVGINIAPLLAGAGVVGVAIGFGSQSLVKDFLTGLFIVAENTIAVGDVVKIDAFSGVVEALSIRTLRLRDVDGSLHIFPFSEVTKITNMTRSFSYALVDVGVAYDSDLEHVMRIMREVGASIQEDPVFKRVILEPIEIMGIQDLGASSITMRARMRTRPGKQWDVRRLMLLRIKQRFDTESIEIPFPTVTQILKTNPPKNA
jgi:small conductance mechanosensitive channel